MVSTLLLSFLVVCRVVENWSPWIPLSLAPVKHGGPLLSCFSSHTINKCPFCGLFVPLYFLFFILLVISLFKRAPHAEVLSSEPERSKTVMGLIEKIGASAMLCSGMSYSAVDHECNDNESTVYIK